MKPNRVVATATIDRNDNLYHIDDINQFNILSNFPNLNLNESASLITPETPFYTTQEVKLGSARNFVKNSRQYLNLLQWVHVRLGHPSQPALKKMVLNKSVLGLGVLWDDIKDLELGICNSCMKSRMHDFPIPSSISKKIYGILNISPAIIALLKPCLDTDTTASTSTLIEPPKGSLDT
jgi:hypothetical protein